MSKFDLKNFFYKTLLEAGEEQEQQQTAQPQNPPQEQGANQQPQPQQPQNNPSEAFRSLQGQTIAGVQYSPNGDSGGVVKIKVKNSYIPFTISWVNQQVTVTTTTGETIVLSGE